MYTLVYLNGNLNRPDTLPSFLQFNVEKCPLIQIDCVTPFHGSADELIEKVCEHLNSIDHNIDIAYVDTQNASSEVVKTVHLVHFLELQIQVRNRNK